METPCPQPKRDTGSPLSPLKTSLPLASFLQAGSSPIWPDRKKEEMEDMNTGSLSQYLPPKSLCRRLEQALEEEGKEK